jgi:nucleoside-triphosphatase
MSLNIFITGEPRTGKSTLIKKVVEKFKEKNLRVGGILTPEIRTGGFRKGFWIIDIASGKREILAAIDFKGPKVSKYGVNIEGIDKIVNLFSKSFENIDLCVIDEIGKMEFFSEEFKEAVNSLVDSEKTLIAVLHRSFVKDFEKYGEIFEVTRENHEEVIKKILELVRIRKIN